MHFKVKYRNSVYILKALLHTYFLFELHIFETMSPYNPSPKITLTIASIAVETIMHSTDKHMLLYTHL